EISSKERPSASFSTTTRACAGFSSARQRPSSVRSSARSVSRAGSAVVAARVSSSSGAHSRARRRLATSRHVFTTSRWSQVENWATVVPDSLAPEFVEPLLRGRFGQPYRYAEVCPSTQRLLSESDPEGTVAVAEEQSEGRGRLGRSWHAPPRTSILFSVLLLPRVAPPRLPELSVVAGQAVADALAAAASVVPAVKLPNDVLVGGRKVAGVLAEASDGRVRLG